MSIEGMIIYGVASVLTLFSLVKDRGKTWIGIKKGIRSFLKLLPVLIPLFLFVGILMTLVTPEIISRMLGEESGVLGVSVGLLVGSVTFMPPFVAFPLGRELLNSGAAYPQVAGFLVTLMSVGVVYFAAESIFFSKKSALVRNLVSFIGAIVVVLVVMVVAL
ncbi:MAG: permease [Bacillota bacterium]